MKGRQVYVREEHSKRETKYVICELSCGHNVIIGARYNPYNDYNPSDWETTELDEDMIMKIWKAMKIKKLVYIRCHKLDGGYIDRMTCYVQSGSPFQIDKNGRRFSHTELHIIDKINVGVLDSI